MKKFKTIYQTRISAFINEAPQKVLFGVKDNAPVILTFNDLKIDENVLRFDGIDEEILKTLSSEILITAVKDKRSVTLRAKKRNGRDQFEIFDLKDETGEDLKRALKSDRLIFLFRHGQTDFNVKGLTQGAEADEPLNENGVRQALDRAYLFKGKTVNFFSSPQIRARRTGENLLKEAVLLTDKDDERFSEIHLGPLNGEPLLHAPLSVFYFPILPETEDPDDLFKRVDEAIRDIGKNYSGDSVVVSHGCALGNWLYRKTGNPDLVLDKNLDCIVAEAGSGDILIAGPDEETLYHIINRSFK